MVNATINGIAISVEDGTTILEAARKVGVEIPTLCYLKEVNEIGACRVCVVEVEGQDRCVTACNNVVQEGMVIRTNTRKRYVQQERLMLSLYFHSTIMKCASCVRSVTVHYSHLPMNLIYLRCLMTLFLKRING